MHCNGEIKRDRRAEIDMKTDRQQRKYTAITSMIKCSAQFNSILDCPVGENGVGGRGFDRCVNVLLLPTL